ncbi:phage tail protein [Limnobaculum zhutongyuii]|uniref:Phage tail protein n=1 Tax=Limnobaculum zhutongyuii TaxID=2498113 RepID=A0A411WGW9_9GAMM|nr:MULTISPECIES: phage tail protein [Limnobaculum]QBH95463.1 phage tail protein [Limnobaculum zhutongyuii]TQS88848.1 phage tail protein [Limnobaculum zhutongyuii]
MADEYVGAISLELDSREIEVTEVSVNIQTGRKLVKTMNKSGRAKGFARGVEEIEIDVTAVVPLDGEVDWKGIEGAKITTTPISGSGGKRTSYQDCFTTSVGRQYTVDNEARINLKMNALREVIE